MRLSHSLFFTISKPNSWIQYNADYPSWNRKQKFVMGSYSYNAPGTFAQWWLSQYDRKLYNDMAYGSNTRWIKMLILFMSSNDFSLLEVP